MKGKTLSTVIKFGGIVDDSLNKAINSTKTKAIEAANKMNSAMKNGTKMATNSMTGAFKGVAKTAAKAFAAITAVSQLKAFAAESVTAAKAQIEVQTKLGAVLKNVESVQIRGPNAAQDAAAKLMGVADSLERVGVVGADITMAGMQQLATFQLSDDQIGKLSGGMTDLLAQQKGLNASQGDAVTIGNMIGKAMSGNVGALSKVGISFSEAQAKAIKLGDANQRAAVIAEVLQQNVGGVNKALGETDQGQMMQTQNMFDAIKEEIGYGILPLLAQISKKVLPYLTKGVDFISIAFKKISPNINSFLDGAFGNLEKIVPSVIDFIGQIAPIMGEAFSSIGGISKDIMPLVLNSLQKFLPVIMQVVDSIAPLAVTLAGTLLPVIEELLPVLADLSITLFPAVIDVFNEIVPIIGDIVKAILPVVKTLLSSLLPVIQQLLPPIQSIISSIFPVLIDLFQQIAPVVMQLVSSFAPLIAQLITSLMPAITALLPPLNTMIQAILPVISVAIEALSNLFSSLIPVIVFIADVISAALVVALQILTPIINIIIERFTIFIDILSNVIDFIVNVFTGNWAGAFENIKSIFNSVFEGMASIAKGAFNGVISIINGAIDGINLILKGINKVSKYAGLEVSTIPSIPYLAKGATVTRPTLAMIGERGPETVVPHNNKPRSQALLAEAAKGVGINRISNTSSISNHNSDSKIANKFIYSPTIYANDAVGVKEALENQFEQFKEWYVRMMEEERREAFG